MAWPAAIATREFWSATGRIGTRSRWEFDGEEGLRRLSGPQSVFTAQAPEFHARLQRLQLRHYAIEAFSGSPHTAARGPAEIDAFSVPLIGIAMVERGSLLVESEGRAFTVPAGHAFLFDTCHAFVCTAWDEVGLLRALAFRDALQVADGPSGAFPAAPVAQTRLLAKFFDLVRTVLRNDSVLGTGAEDLLSDALLQLHAALLLQELGDPRDC